MANTPDRHAAGSSREGYPGDAPSPDGDWGWLRRAVGPVSPSLAGQPPGQDEGGLASHPIAFSDTSSMGSRVGSMSNMSVVSMATPEPSHAKQASSTPASGDQPQVLSALAMASHPIAFSDTSSMGSRVGSLSNMSVVSMTTPEPSPAKQASSTPASGDQPQVVSAVATQGRSSEPLSEATAAGTAVQRQGQMQSAPRLPPSPETAGKHDGSMSPAAKSPFGDFSEPESTAFGRSSGTFRRSLEGPAAMHGFARVDLRSSPQKAGGPAGSSLGTEVSLKHGLGSGDISAQGIQGVSQLDSMPSLASGMGQRGSLDIDPAIAERYRQSRLQAAPIPEETDLTFSSGMQPRAGQEVAWERSGEGEVTHDSDGAGRSQSGGAPLNHLRMPGKLAPLVIPARQPEQEAVPAKQEPPPPTAYPHDAGWASHLAGKRDAAHQPSPKTDALVDQLLTGVVGNQLKEAPGSQPTQGMDTSRLAGASMRTADRGQAAMPPPSVRGRSIGPATPGASRLARLAAERQHQGAQEGTDSRSPRFGLAPTPTPTPSRASSAESGSAVGSSSLAGAANSEALDVDPQELSHALEQATESSSSAAAAAGRDTGTQVSAQPCSPVSSQPSARAAGSGRAVAGGSLGAGGLPRIQIIPQSRQPESSLGSSLAQSTAATLGSPAAGGSARSAGSGSGGPRSPRPPRSPSSAHSTHQSPKSPFQAASAFATGLASSAGGAVLSAWDAVMPPRSPVSSPRTAPAASMSGKAAIQSAASDTSTSSTAASPFRPSQDVGPSAAAAVPGGSTGQLRKTSQEGPAWAGRGAQQRRGFQGGSGEVMPGQSWEEYAAGLNKSAPAGADEEPAAGHTRPAASAGRGGADLAAAPPQAGSSAEQGWAAALPAAGVDRCSLPSVLGKQDRAVPLVAQDSAAEHSEASTVAVGASEGWPGKRQHTGESAAEAEQGPRPVQASGAAAAQQEGSAASVAAPARGRSSASSSGSQTPSRSSLIKRAVAEVNWQSASPTSSPRALKLRGSPRGSPQVGAVSTGRGQRGPPCEPQAEELAPATAQAAAGRSPAAVDLGQVQAGQAGEPQAEGHTKPQGLPAAVRNSQAAEPPPGRASTVSGQEESAVGQQFPVRAAPIGAASAQGKPTAATASKGPAAAAGLRGARAEGTDGPAFPSTSIGREDAEQSTGTQVSSAMAPSALAPAAVDSPSLGNRQPAAANVGVSPNSQQQPGSGGKADAAGAISVQAGSLPSAEGTPASGVDSEQGGPAIHDLPRSSHSHPQQGVTSGAGPAPAGQAEAQVSPAAGTTAGTPYTGSGSTLRLGRLVMDDEPSSPSAEAVPAGKASFQAQDRVEAGMGPRAVPAAAAEEPGQGRETHSQVPVGTARADGGAASPVDDSGGRGSQEDSEAVLQRGTGVAGAAAVAAGADKAGQDQKTPAKQGSRSPLSPLSLETSPEYSPTDRTPEQGSPADSPWADRASEAAGGHQGQQQSTQSSATGSAAQQGAGEGAKLGSSTAGAQLPPVERPGAVASEPWALQPGRQAAKVEASSDAAGAASSELQGSALAGTQPPAGGIAGLSPEDRQAGRGTAAPRPAPVLALESPAAAVMGAQAGSQGQALPSKTASGAQGTASAADAASRPHSGRDAEAVPGSSGPWERSGPHQPVVPVELSSTAVKKVFGQGEPLAQPLLAKTESGRVTLSPEVAEAAAGRDPQKCSSVLNAAWASASAADREGAHGAQPSRPPAAGGLAADASGAQRPPVAESPNAGGTSRLGRRPGSEELPLPSAVSGQAGGPGSPPGAPAANRAPADRMPPGRTAAGGAAPPPGAAVEPAAHKHGNQALPYGLQKSGDERPAKPADTADPSEAYASSRTQRFNARDAALKPEPEGLNRAAQLPAQAGGTDEQVAHQQSRRAPTGTSSAALASDAAAGSGLFSAAAVTATSSSPEAMPARGDAATGSSEPAQAAPGESDRGGVAGMPARGKAESLTVGRTKAPTTAGPAGSTPTGAGPGASLEVASKSDRDASTAGLNGAGGSGGLTAGPRLAAAQEGADAEAVPPGGARAQQGLPHTPDAAASAVAAQVTGQTDAAAAGQGPQGGGQRAADTVSQGGHQAPRTHSLQLDLPPPFELDLEQPALLQQEAYAGEELGLTKQRANNADFPEALPAEELPAAGQVGRGTFSPRLVGARARRGSPSTPQRPPLSFIDWEAAAEHDADAPGAGPGVQPAPQGTLPGSAIPEEVPLHETAGRKSPAVASPGALGGGGSPASPQHWRAWAPQEGSVSSPGSAGTLGPVGSTVATASQEGRESTDAAPARFTGSSSGTVGQVSTGAASDVGSAGRAAGTAGFEGRAAAAPGLTPGQEGRTSAAGASAPALTASSPKQLTEAAPRETSKGAPVGGGGSTPSALPGIPAADSVAAESPPTESTALETVSAAASRLPAPGTASSAEQLPATGPGMAAKDGSPSVRVGADSAVEHAPVKGASGAQERLPALDAGSAAERRHLSLSEQMAELEEMVLASAAACRPTAGQGSPGASRHSQSGLAVQQAMMTLRAVAAGRPEEATQTANDLPALAKEQPASPKPGSIQAAVVDCMEEVRLALLEAANQRSLYRPLVLRTTSRAVAVLLAVSQGQRLLVKAADEPSSSPKTGSSAPSKAGLRAVSPAAVPSSIEEPSPAGKQQPGQALRAQPGQAAGLEAGTEAAGGQQHLYQPTAQQASPGSPTQLEAGREAAADGQLSRAPREPTAGPDISPLEGEALTGRQAKPEAAIVMGKPGQLALPVGTRRAATADKEQAMTPSAVRLAAGRPGTGTAQGSPDGLSMGAANLGGSGKAGAAATSGLATAGQQPGAPAPERAAPSQSAGSVNGRQSSFNDALYGSHPSATGMQPPTLQHEVGDASEESGKTRFACCGFGGGKKRGASQS